METVNKKVENRFSLANRVLLNPPESARTFSSSVGDAAPGKYDASSMLDSTSGWLPKLAGAGGIDQWLRVDLGASTNVVGVVTQGRFGGGNQYAKKYEVLTSVDGSTFVTRGSFDTGSTHPNGRNKNVFSSSVECRYVKFVVKEVGGSWAALRAGFIVQRAAPNPIASVECRYVKIVVKRAGIDYAALRAAVVVQRAARTNQHPSFPGPTANTGQATIDVVILSSGTTPVLKYQSATDTATSGSLRVVDSRERMPALPCYTANSDTCTGDIGGTADLACSGQKLFSAVITQYAKEFDGIKQMSTDIQKAFQDSGLATFTTTLSSLPDIPCLDDSGCAKSCAAGKTCFCANKLADAAISGWLKCYERPAVGQKCTFTGSCQSSLACGLGNTENVCCSNGSGLFLSLWSTKHFCKDVADGATCR